MELLYNPEQMSEEEIRGTFVARENLLEALLSIIEHQPEGPGVQHVLLIGPRGMGKTTVMLMLRLLLQDRSLTDRWQPLKFPEESHGVADLADLWCETLERLAADTQDTALLEQTEALKKDTGSGEEIAAAALALLRDWSRRSGKRLLLMLENLDQLFDQFGDEQELARLRDVLMNDGTVMLLGSTTSYFHEVNGYEQPFYNFFKLYDVQDLKLEEIQTLLSRRAAHDRNFEVEKKLQAETMRLRAMRHFTGGNPRLVLMLYRVITLSGIDEVRGALEKLLDEITPYYQAKTQSLPPQQRKILDHLARAAAENREAPSPGEIAAATRLPPNQVSAQLKRLTELGYVVPADLRGRKTYYGLSEPLYSVWYQMRFGRGSRRRIEWLVTFLRLWYTPDEIRQEGERLGTRFRSLLTAGRLKEARQTLESGRCLAEAAEFIPGALRTWDWVTQAYAEPQGATRLAGRSWHEEGGMTPKSTPQGLKPGEAAAEVARAVQEGIQALKDGKPEQALLSFRKALELAPSDAHAHRGEGMALLDLKRHEEALASFERSLQLQPDHAIAWFNKGLALRKLGRHEEALVSYERSLRLEPDDAAAWSNKGFVLGNLGRYEEALASFERSLQLQPDHATAWFNKGLALRKLGRHEEALASYERSLRLEPDDAAAWSNKGVVLDNLGRHEEALASYERSLQLQPDHANAWFNKGFVLGNLGRIEEALASYERGLQLQPDHAIAWFNKGVVLGNLGRIEEALASYERSLRLEPDDAAAWLNKGVVLDNLGRIEEALANYEHCLQLQPDHAVAWFNKGLALSKLGRHRDALGALGRCLDLSRANQEDRGFTAGVARFLLATRLATGELNAVKHDWRLLLDLTASLDEGHRQETLLETLKFVAQGGHFELARHLAAESGLEDLLFPLIRALDYATTGDRALIEKLPPELKSVVEEIVAALPAQQRETSSAPRSSKSKKRKRKPSSRTRKKLS